MAKNPASDRKEEYYADSMSAPRAEKVLIVRLFLRDEHHTL